MSHSLRPFFYALILATSACAAATEEEPDEATEGAPVVPDGPCVAGQSVACSCGAGEMGAALCDEDGSGFGQCSCDDSATTTSDSSSSTATSSAPTTEESTLDPSETDPNSDDSSGSDESGSAEVSFDRDIKPLLVTGCGGSTDACHSRVAYGADFDFDCRGWVALEDAPIGSQFYGGEAEGQATGCPDMPLYDRLLQLNSWQCGSGTPGEGLPVVVPGDPENSYMMMKIDGRGLCMAGGEPSLQMPPPEEAFVLAPEGRDLIEAWILAGALNN